MNKNNDPMLRALYIILVPIVALIIVLNSGMLQKTVPAASVGGESYSVARYNYYYFDFYNAFLEENADRLGELGYDPKLTDTKQFTADGISWKEFFLRQAEADMAETAYYCGLAAQAGYEFSDEELRPVRERLEEDAARQAASRINAKNYYTAYYGAGMTEAIYTTELTRQVKAAAYRDYLIRSAEPSQAEIDAYIRKNAIPDYRTADLRIITLEAQPDRETGEVGPEQENALTQKMQRLVERYDAGESFESLQAAFSTCALGDSRGYLHEATRLDLPQNIADDLFFGGGDPVAYPDGYPIGWYMTTNDGTTEYFILLDAWGGSGPVREATLALGQDALLARAETEIEAQYPVHRKYFGMLLATA